MLNFDSNEQEENLANDHILEVILGLVVFELNMKAVFNANFHLDWVVDFRLLAHILNSKVDGLHDVRSILTTDLHAEEVPEKKKKLSSGSM